MVEVSIQGLAFKRTGGFTSFLLEGLLWGTLNTHGGSPAFLMESLYGETTEKGHTEKERVPAITASLSSLWMF